MEKAFFNTIKKFAFQLADKKSFLNEFAFEIDKLSAISIEVDLSGKSYEENIRILTKESLNTFAYGNGTFSN